jgi:hypothetical protein
MILTWIVNGANHKFIIHKNHTLNAKKKLAIAKKCSIFSVSVSVTNGEIDMWVLSKKMRLALMLSLGLMVSGCGDKTEDTKPAAIEKKHTVSWLFVVQAKSGEITQLIDKKSDSAKKEVKKYTLTLTDTGQVIRFTDRPDRIVDYEKVKTLEADWTKGNDSFKVTPPNAVLSSANITHPVIVVLDSIKTKDGKTIFTFHSAKHNKTDDILSKLVRKKNLNNVVVTIDDGVGTSCDMIKLALPLPTGVDPFCNNYHLVKTLVDRRQEGVVSGADDTETGTDDGKTVIEAVIDVIQTAE